jgi:hypothetical protein
MVQGVFMNDLTGDAMGLGTTGQNPLFPRQL